MRFVMPSLAALGLLVSLSACGGSHEGTAVEPLASAASATPGTDATAAARSAFEGYVTAVDQAIARKAADPLLPYATAAWADAVIDQYRSNLWSKDRTIIGTNTVLAATAAVTGGTATVSGCVDSSNAFEVPQGTTTVAPGSGAKSIGRWHAVAQLVLEGERWKVSDITSDEQPC